MTARRNLGSDKHEQRSLSKSRVGRIDLYWEALESIREHLKHLKALKAWAT